MPAKCAGQMNRPSPGRRKSATMLAKGGARVEPPMPMTFTPSSPRPTHPPRGAPTQGRGKAEVLRPPTEGLPALREALGLVGDVANARRDGLADGAVLEGNAQVDQAQVVEHGTPLLAGDANAKPRAARGPTSP